eukprot:Hpha_TRINITY_DN31313_c0_g1::TRINITY_DN31313_c0_g1_i1::g.194523::m.194523
MSEIGGPGSIAASGMFPPFSEVLAASTTELSSAAESPGGLPRYFHPASEDAFGALDAGEEEELERDETAECSIDDALKGALSAAAGRKRKRSSTRGGESAQSPAAEGSGGAWKKAEVERLYEGLRQFGAEASLIVKLFPTRNLRAVRARLRREERLSPVAYRRALNAKANVDHQWLEDLSALSSANETRQRLAAERAAREAVPDPLAEVPAAPHGERSALQGLLDQQDDSFLRGMLREGDQASPAAPPLPQPEPDAASFEDG